MLETTGELMGNFSGGPSVSWERGCHEGVLYKPADASLDAASGSGGYACLSGGSLRDSGTSACGRARGRADGAKHDLDVAEKFVRCSNVSRMPSISAFLHRTR